MANTVVTHASRSGLRGLAAAISLLAMSGSAALARTVYLPAGTVIPVRLDTQLSSKTAQAGDKFVASVVYGKDDAGVPEGSRVEGTVREAVPSADGKPGVLDLDFRRIVFGNGDRANLEAGLVSLDAKSVKRSESGRLVATNDKSKDRLKFVGIGAGAGLVIAALTKGNTIFDTVLGAGAGYLYNELKKDKPGDVNLKSGTQFGVRLDRQVAYSTTGTDTRRYHGSTPARYDDTRYYAPGSDRTAPANSRDEQRVDNGSDIGMLVDGRNVTFDGPRPFRQNGVTYVPLAAVARGASFDYTYDAGTRLIRARHNSVRMSLNSRVLTINGTRHLLPAPAMLRSGTLYVPMQFVGYATGGTVSWDDPSQTILVTSEEDR